MKKLFGFTLILLLCSIFFLGQVSASSTNGTIDPANEGFFKAAVLNDPGIGGGMAINFGRFTLTPASNITISNNQIYGYAWGASTGWIVMNCFNTTSGCSAANGNFKVSVSDDGILSGYAWGENTGWINFGPFTNVAIPQVRIDQNGVFTGTIGTIGTAGYAWSANMGYIIFDCASAATCVKTDYIPTKVYGATPIGAGSPGGHYSTNTTTLPNGTTTTTSTSTTPTNPVTPVKPTVPKSTPLPPRTTGQTPGTEPTSTEEIPILEIPPQPYVAPRISVNTAPPSIKMGGSNDSGTKVWGNIGANPVVESVKKTIIQSVSDSKELVQTIAKQVHTQTQSRALPVGLATLVVALVTTLTGVISLSPVAVGTIGGISFKMASMVGGTLGAQKKSRKILEYFAKHKQLCVHTIEVLLGIGLFSIAITSYDLPVYYGALVFLGYGAGAYLCLKLLYGIHVVTTEAGELVSQALIEVYAPALGNHKITQIETSLYGTYHIEVPNGLYYMTVSTKNLYSENEYTRAHTTENFEVKKGQIIKEIVIKTK